MFSKITKNKNDKYNMFLSYARLRFNNKGMAIEGECVRREQEPTARRGQERERGSEYRS